MSISHTVSITALQICNDSNNVVSSVTVSVASSDSSDPVSTLMSDTIPVGLNTVGVTSAVGFVTYANLTESKVLSWSDSQGVGISSYIEDVKNANIEYINHKLNPPVENYVYKDIPW